MQIHKMITICLIFSLSGCDTVKNWFADNRCLEKAADRHEIKLKQYFTSGKGNAGDVSTLISETRTMSSKLKAAGLNERANKFDSYIDVLSYGNRTLDESIKDTQNLVKTPYQPSKSKVCAFLDKWL